MRKKRIWLWAVIVVILLLAAGLAVAGNYFYNYALKPRRNELAPGVRNAGEGAVPGTSAWGKFEWADEQVRDVYIQSDDGLSLHGYRVDAEGNRYAIVVHGYTADAQSMMSFGKQFHDRGYSILLPNMRGHGESEGDYIAMGWHDRLDMLRWIDMIIQENPQAEILLFGISMGGATVMMTAGEPMPPQVKLVIEDCGYSSVWEEFSGQLHEQFGLPPFPLLYAASAVARLRAGFWLSEADAARQVAKCEVPILFIHGDADTFVPYWMMETLYDAATCEKEKFVVEGAAHGTASTTDPQGYWAAIDSFIERYW